MAPRKSLTREALETELRALADLDLVSAAPADLERLRAALAHPSPLVVERAARVARKARLADVGAALVATFRRLLVDPVKRDPGCGAKLAALESLDLLEHPDRDLFVVACRHVQMEPAWGPPVDTAGPLRARGVAALASLADPDLPLVAAQLLADREAPVRQAAADALAHHGARAGAAPLALKLAVGDEDPVVLASCFAALFALAPEVGLDRARAALEGDDEVRREAAALALAESSDPDALALLLAELDARVLLDERAVVIRALALHRSDAALEALTEILATRSPAEATLALEALAPRHGDPRVRDALTAAIEAREDGAEGAVLFPDFRDPG